MKNPARLAAACLMALAPAALAQSPVGDLDKVRLFVESQASTATARVEVTIGQPDSRLTLAPCQRAEPFLPAGSRLWGKSWVGLRCVEGARWSITIPVEVKVWGPALISARALPANQPVQASDVQLQEIELSKESATVFADARSLEGKLLARPVAAGQAMRTDFFKAAPVIAQGDAVRLVAKGPGFSVSTDALALQHAGDGQAIRVKTEAGRVVTGVARPGRVVEVPIADAGAGR